MFGLLRPTHDAHSRTLPASYRSVYCDLCAVLAWQYGLKARPLIVHDLAAVGWLLESPDAPAAVFPRTNCLRGGTRSVRPAERQPPNRTRLLAALSCYAVAVKLRDDLNDEPSWRVRALHSLYARTFARADRDLVRLGFPLEQLEGALAQQEQIERQNTADLDVASEATGRAYATVARCLAATSPSGASVETAFAIGNALGRCVYVIDAYRDIETDHGVSYNPLCCGDSRSGTRLSARRREARAYVAAQLRLVGDSVNEPTGSLGSRWPAIEHRLRRLVGLEPKPVTLNAVICIPCDDDKCCWPVLCGCFCCSAWLCGNCCA